MINRITISSWGVCQDKADVDARIGWSGTGIDLKTNNPTPDAIRTAALDTSDCRRHAQRLATEFAAYDARIKTLRLLRRHSADQARATGCCEASGPNGRISGRRFDDDMPGRD